MAVKVETLLWCEMTKIWDGFSHVCELDEPWRVILFTLELGLD